MNLNLLKRVARNSSHAKYNHATLIFAGSRLLVAGYNNKDHHSEIMALRRLNALLRNQARKPKNLHLVNIMIKKKTGAFGNSFPCESCHITIMASGIRTIDCFDSQGRIHHLGGMI